jgi:hypothetical protein
VAQEKRRAGADVHAYEYAALVRVQERIIAARDGDLEQLRADVAKYERIVADLVAVAECALALVTRLVKRNKELEGKR